MNIILPSDILLYVKPNIIYKEKANFFLFYPEIKMNEHLFI